MKDLCENLASKIGGKLKVHPILFKNTQKVVDQGCDGGGCV